MEKEIINKFQGFLKSNNPDINILMGYILKIDLLILSDLINIKIFYPHNGINKLICNIEINKNPITVIRYDNYYKDIVEILFVEVKSSSNTGILIDSMGMNDDIYVHITGLLLGNESRRVESKYTIKNKNNGINTITISDHLKTDIKTKFIQQNIFEETEENIKYMERLLYEAENNKNPNFTYYQLCLMSFNAPSSAYKKLVNLMISKKIE
jgi:hypothetical protein